MNARGFVRKMREGGTFSITAQSETEYWRLRRTAYEAKKALELCELARPGEIRISANVRELTITVSSTLGATPISASPTASSLTGGVAPSTSPVDEPPPPPDWLVETELPKLGGEE